jgi:hypothetical protein
MGKDVTSTCRTGTHLIFKSNPAVIFKSIPAVVNVGRILLDSATLTLATLAVLVLIGLWERHAQEATALGFSGIYERYLAFEAGFPNDPRPTGKPPKLRLCHKWPAALFCPTEFPGLSIYF